MIYDDLKLLQNVNIAKLNFHYINFLLITQIIITQFSFYLFKMRQKNKKNI